MRTFMRLRLIIQSMGNGVCLYTATYFPVKYLWGPVTSTIWAWWHSSSIWRSTFQTRQWLSSLPVSLVTTMQ